MNRRIIAIVVAAVLPLLLALAAVWGEPTRATAPSFASLGTPTMPFVPYQGFINSTWFCPGVPNGGDGLGGSVTVANPRDVPLVGHLTVFTDALGVGAAEIDFEVPARDTFTTELSAVQGQGSYLSAMVEINGGGGWVEQQADHPDGSAVSACSNSTSNTWYFADNYTLFDSQEDLVITNPFPDKAIIDFEFANDDGTVRTPGRLQGIPIEGNSILIVDQRELLKDEATMGISIVAGRGRVIAARAQQYLGERQGFSLSLGAPAPSVEWTFADGENSGENFERYAIYNPSDHDAVVAPVFLGIVSDTFYSDIEITVGAGRVVSFSIADVPDLPSGFHGASFSSQNGVPIVVERAITRPAGDGGGFVTTVVRGVESSFAAANTGYFRWSTAIGTDLAVDDVLVVMNLSGFAGTVTVSALGAGGELPVAGLEAIELGGNSIVRIAIPQDVAALGHPLIITADQPIVVERLLPRGGELRGRSGSLALPG